LMASTNELRAEIVRCDPRDDGPCARCYNDPEHETPDDTRRQAFLDASLEDQRALAAAAGTSLEAAVSWAMTGECGTSGERVREVMGEPANAMTHFATPFTSGAAGTMLAAEVVKEELAAPVPLSTRQPRATIQFWRPAQSAGAKPYRRDLSCP